MKTSVYWTEDCPRPANLPISPLPEVTDVAIIGGGYTGLNAALALRKAGASVAVLEKETIGWGASSRNGGMALTGLKESMPVVFKRYGAEMGRAFWQWSLDAVNYVEQLTVEEKIDCNFVRSGHLLLAFKPQHFAQFVEEARWFREQLGYTDLWVVSKAELHSEIGSAAYHGGLIDPRSAGLHPARYVFGLAQAAARKGALLVERTALMDVKRTRTGFLVITNRGTLNAREVLVATNGYTTNVIRPLRQGVFPVGSYIITTEPLPLSLQEELSPRAHVLRQQTLPQLFPTDARWAHALRRTPQPFDFARPHRQCAQDAGAHAGSLPAAGGRLDLPHLERQPGHCAGPDAARWSRQRRPLRVRLRWPWRLHRQFIG